MQVQGVVTQQTMRIELTLSKRKHRKRKQLLDSAIVMCLLCASPVTTSLLEERQSNWISADAPCARVDDLRNSILGNIGVKIDAAEPWAHEFRRALSFWNTVLDANFHEEANLNACTIRIVNGGPDVLMKAVAARSQFTEWDNFRGKIAVSSAAVKEMDSVEMYAVAVHELGHMLGLKHNASSRSIMFYFNVSGTEVLDNK